MSSHETSRPAATRRRVLFGGAALGAATLTPLSQALAGAPVPPGPKPDVPLLFQIGRKPTPPQDAMMETVSSRLPTPPAGGPRVRSLALDNIHTGERLNVTYMENGHYLPDALQAINHIMRDRRTDAVAPIDPALLDLLSDIRRRLEARSPLEIISAYRAPGTNARMRQAGRGVAKNSYHIRGMAADIAIPGYGLADLRRLALTMGRGGVGYYPRSGFVHVDVGPPRAWRG
ncbi:DUF882 domain-containing protein [Rhodospira trueperi]|uniref:Murein endopeptidase K n=1 Tax=Rhodospira trueperi TaxID=69960 RepID=A0A1G7B423_9PROT|nr:DUF882 domain-containing protein [Rhodospira trueperi]SDE21858.1 Uncharacterized conserved protein YcbK, DUF882 family [Rhodospira trueperi]